MAQGKRKENMSTDEQMEKRRKRKTRNNEVVHSIFEECAKNVEDEYWKDIFNHASRGKFPRSFSYTNKNLIYHIGNQKKNIGSFG